MNDCEFTYIDLFAGAGGLSEGFIRAGYQPIAHVEYDKAACYTLRTRMAYHWLKSQNRSSDYNDYIYGRITREELYQLIPPKIINSVINEEIRQESLEQIFNSIDSILEKQPLDLIIGGPPCQAYSLVGRSRDKNKMKGDKRNNLYIFYAAFLKHYQPNYFVFENVTGLRSAKNEEGKSYLENMKTIFRDIGYETELRTLSADNYGVLQRRKRVIIVGKKGQTSSFFPEPDTWQSNVTVGEVFTDLPVLHAGEGTVSPCIMKEYTGQYLYNAAIRNDQIGVTWHQSRPNTEQDLEIYRIVVDRWNTLKQRLDYNSLPDILKTHKNRHSFIDRFKVVASDLKSSHTVVAHIAKDGHYYIHPDIEQNRSITPREAARLQTFPDDYFFESCNGIYGRTPAFRQIGNAVPVLLAQKIAEKLKEVWT